MESVLRHFGKLLALRKHNAMDKHADKTNEVQECNVATISIVLAIATGRERATRVRDRSCKFRRDRDLVHDKCERDIDHAEDTKN